jgi:hypothetical protein
MSPGRMLGLVIAAAAAFFLLVMVPGVADRQAAMGGGNFYSVGPTALPYLAGAMTLVFAVMVALTARPAPALDEPAAGEAAEETNKLGRGLVFIALFAAYSVGMLYVGFLVASVVFLAAVFLMFGVRSLAIGAALALFLPVLTDYLLRNVFLVPLPSFPYW